MRTFSVLIHNLLFSLFDLAAETQSRGVQIQVHGRNIECQAFRNYEEWIKMHSICVKITLDKRNKRTCFIPLSVFNFPKCWKKKIHTFQWQQLGCVGLKYPGTSSDLHSNPYKSSVCINLKCMISSTSNVAVKTEVTSWNQSSCHFPLVASVWKYIESCGTQMC